MQAMKINKKFPIIQQDDIWIWKLEMKDISLGNININLTTTRVFVRKAVAENMTVSSPIIVILT